MKEPDYYEIVAMEIAQKYEREIGNDGVYCLCHDIAAKLREDGERLDWIGKTVMTRRLMFDALVPNSDSPVWFVETVAYCDEVDTIGEGFCLNDAIDAARSLCGD